MDIAENLSPSEIRARIFSCKSRIHELKEKRKRYHTHIKQTKLLLKNVERNCDKRTCAELNDLEISTIRHFLYFLQETLIDLDYFWQKEAQYCTSLHGKLDKLGEKVYSI
jgi:hypothetical protein